MDAAARRARAELLTGREVRTLVTSGMETRAAAGVVTFEGLASRTNHPYDMGWYDETISRGAFTKTLSEGPDVQLLTNHGGLPLARTTNKSLDLRETDNGLEFTARCPDSDPDVQSLRSKVDSGLMDQCSFAFRVIRQSWVWADEQAADAAAPVERDQRSILEVSLHRGDVSICNYGANPATPVTVRSAFAGLADLTDEQLAEWREDPHVIAAVRRLGYVLPTQPDVPVVEVVPVEPIAEFLSADLARARAWALIHRR